MLPLATTPVIWAALPAMNARGADYVAEVGARGLFIVGSSVRSIVDLNVCAVTGSFEGGEKRNPRRIVNV